jgi:hypothetical protein
MHERWTTWADRWRRRLRSSGRARLVAAGVLVCLLVLGTVGLLQGLDGQDSTEAEPVAPGSAAERDPMDDLRRAADGGEVWLTQDQRRRQWEVARMATLSRLVERFAPVEQATVLLENGSGGGLNGPKRPTTAAVHLRLTAGETMTPQLLDALADLLTGSVADLDGQRVRVIDSTGRSYRPGARSPRSATFDEALRLEQRWEAYYRQRVLGVLPESIRSTVAVRTASGSDGRPEPRAVLVAVPRTKLTDALQTDVCRLAGGVLGLPAEAVTVCGVGSLLRSKPAEAETNSPGTDRWRVAWVATVGLVEVVLVAAILTRRMHRRRKRRAWSRVRAAARRRRTRTAPAGRSTGRPLELLMHASVEDLVTLLSGESPETVAMVLSQLSPSRAGRVLAGLPGQTQVAVAGQIASLEQVDQKTMDRLERDLADRMYDLNHTGPQSAGGVRAVARILQHTGQHGRRGVLEALARQEPRLAETISRQLLGFEDISQMPSHRLGPALASVDTRELALALWTAGQEVRERIVSALPAERGEALQRALAGPEPVRLSQVDSARQEIVQAVRDYEAAQSEHVVTAGERTA